MQQPSLKKNLSSSQQTLQGENFGRNRNFGRMRKKITQHTGNISIDFFLYAFPSVVILRTDISK